MRHLQLPAEQGVCVPESLALNKPMDVVMERLA
jgi:hypothetical protein